MLTYCQHIAGQYLLITNNMSHIDCRTYKLYNHFDILPLT